MNRQCSLGWHDECSDPFGESCECECHPWILRNDHDQLVQVLEGMGAKRMKAGGDELIGGQLFLDEPGTYLVLRLEDE